MRLNLFLPGLALAFASLPADAGLTLTLSPAAQSGSAASPAAFFGTISNANASGNLYLNNLSLSFDGGASEYLAAQPNVFFANVPGILLPGESYTDIIFAISVAPAAPPGSYAGTVSIQGGSDEFASGTLASQTFQVATAPMLAISHSGNNVLISWPPSPSNFVLQQNSSLATIGWEAVTNNPTEQNGQYQVVLPCSGAGQFYRLKQQ